VWSKRGAWAAPARRVHSEALREEPEKRGIADSSPIEKKSPFGHSPAGVRARRENHAKLGVVGHRSQLPDGQERQFAGSLSPALQETPLSQHEEAAGWSGSCGRAAICSAFDPPITLSGNRCVRTGPGSAPGSRADRYATGRGAGRGGSSCLQFSRELRFEIGLEAVVQDENAKCRSHCASRTKVVRKLRESAVRAGPDRGALTCWRRSQMRFFSIHRNA